MANLDFSAERASSEVRWLAIDGAVLVGGLLSIAVFYPPAMIALAAAHLVVEFLIAPNRTAFLTVTALTVAAGVIVTWMMWLWIPSPFLALLGTGPDWAILIPVAILGGGVISSLLAVAGLASEVVELRSKAVPLAGPVER